MTYSIGQVARQLGITIDTIRYYDKQGLLPFLKRDSNGRRIFSTNDIHLMRTIICLKNAGVPVSEIAQFVELRLQGDSTLRQRYHLLEDHEKNLQTQIRDLEDTLSYLKFKKWYYQTAVEADTEKIHFVNNSNEVIPDLSKEYEAYLEHKKDFNELQRFENVRDYREKP